MKGFVDKLLVGWGYIKSASVALTTSAGFGYREYPSPRTTNMLEAYASWVFGCVKARARDTSRIEINLYKVVNRKTGEVQEVEEHDVLSLLRSVNPFMTFQQLIEYTQAYKDLTGEAFWYLQRLSGKTGLITQIWLLRPDYMAVDTSVEGFVKSYVYTVPGITPVTFQPNEIIHHKEFNPVNPYRGMGVVKAAAVTIDTEVYAEEYNKKFFRNSAVPEIVLTTEQKLTDAQVVRMHAEWANKYGGTQNAHKTAILEGGLDIKSFSISQKDMEFLEGQGFSRDKILALFEVPKSRLGMTEGVTVSNAEATINIYLKYVVKPLMESVRDALNEFLLPQYKGTEDMYFDIEDPVPQDVKAVMEAQRARFAMGAMTPNEVREEAGLDQVDGLDSFYLPVNLATVGGDGQNPQDQQDQNPAEPVTDQSGKAVTYRKKDRTLRRKYVPDLRLIDKKAREVGEAAREDMRQSLKRELPQFSTKDAGSTPAGLGNNKWSIESKEAFWKQVVDVSDHYEKVYQEKLVSYFSREEKEALERLEAVEKKEAVQKLSRGEIDSVLMSVTAENKIAADIFLPLVREIMEESGVDTLEFIGSDVAFDAASAAAQEFMRADALKGIRVMNKVTKSKLRKMLSQAVEDGLGPIDTARKIREVFTEAKTVRALRVARTESLKAANRGALEAYKQSGVVAGKEWYTSKDEAVCQWCAPLHGRVVSTEADFFHQGETYIGKEGGKITFNLESVPTPPLHPNCRCTLLPVTINQRAAEPDINKESAGQA